MIIRKLLRLKSGRLAAKEGSSKKNVELAEMKALLNGSEFFDHDYYRKNYPDIDLAETDPIEHYLLFGARERRNPSALFDTRHYLDQNPEVSEAGHNPLVHFLLTGLADGRTALPTSPTSVEPKAAPQAVMVEEQPPAGFAERVQAIKESAHFDETYYGTAYPDVVAVGIDPAIHYLMEGYREGRDPSRYFSTEFYLKAYPDVAAADVNPLEHFLGYGQREGRRCSPYYIDGHRLPFDLRSEVRSLKIPVANPPHGITRAETSLKIGVHLHCFFVEVVPQLLRSIAKITGDVRLYISVPSQQMIELIDGHLSDHGLEAARYAIVPNRGRDIAPMLIEFAEDLLSCDVALHVHTKKSKEREAFRSSFGEKWLKDIDRNLLFNPTYIEGILSLFSHSESLGVVCPEPFAEISPFMTWGGNLKGAQLLMRKLGYSQEVLSEVEPNFPAGSMCWFRPQALEGLFRLDLDYTDFPPEPIPDDGTLAHAIERCLFEIASQHGFNHVTVSPLPYEKCWPSFLPPKISIVIPVYNAEAWIDQAIQSVLAQDSTHVPVEILLVENGSTDGSLEILEGYTQRHSNIRLLFEKNKGAGDARNCGLRAAKGKYVGFLDADDVLATDALGDLFSIAEADDDIDFATSSLVMFNEKEYRQPIPFGGTSAVKTLNAYYIERDPDEWSQLFFDFGACAKLYRRSFLEEKEIEFPTACNFEDNVFAYDVYLSAETIAVLKKPTYFYRKYEGLSGETQSTQIDQESFREQLSIVEKIIDKHSLRTPGAKEELAVRSLIAKIGWEVQRLEDTEWAGAVLHQHKSLVELIEREEAWGLLGPGGEGLKEDKSPVESAQHQVKGEVEEVPKTAKGAQN